MDKKALEAFILSGNNGCTGNRAKWLSDNKIIPNGVYCYENDTGKQKIGDGIHTYAELPYDIHDILWAMKNILTVAVRRKAWPKSQYIHFYEKTENIVIYGSFNNEPFTRKLWTPTRIDLTADDWEIFITIA